MSEQETSGSAQLGLWDTVCIIVGIVIGTTIFALPWLIFMNTPATGPFNPWAGLSVWVFGGLLALIGGLCYAELASTYPKEGGDYFYLTRGFGRMTGFLFGWAQLIVILPASIGVMAYVFADRLKDVLITLQWVADEDMKAKMDLLKMELDPEFYFAAAAVLAITLLNLIGVTIGKWTQNILTLLKIVGVLAILVCGFLAMDTSQANWKAPTSIGELAWGSLALILVMYAFGGWNDAAFVAAEVKNPQRNIPLALILGIGAITVIYVLINAAYILGLGATEVTKFGNLPAALLSKSFEKGGLIMSCIVMSSALGAISGLIFAGSRVYATVGKDHRLFGFIGWTPGKRSPILALLFQALITMGLVLLFATEKGHKMTNDGLDWVNGHATSVAQRIDGSLSVAIQYDKEKWKTSDAFEALVSHSAPAFWIFFLMTGFALFRLRDKYPTLPRPFSVPLYPLLPIIFCCSCAYMLYQSVTYIGWRTLFVVALLLVGIPLYGLSQLLGGRRDTEI